MDKNSETKVLKVFSSKVTFYRRKKNNQRSQNSIFNLKNPRQKQHKDTQEGKS